MRIWATAAATVLASAALFGMAGTASANDRNVVVGNGNAITSFDDSFNTEIEDSFNRYDLDFDVTDVDFD
ncbi:hypothetical protein E0L36_21685 [Streptomyces sp. AJS327]|uniref:hypothetical protein n=1 Tax=Streptomyces sp. AJS327 TaxID=2545265 RepID=UPI0015DEBEEA|nr:hypothetical protein [Streptomyces sp. AJS327]MBA0053389.1 hypothetical protein [Streptomyces sp. AJS327]